MISLTTPNQDMRAPNQELSSIVALDGARLAPRLELKSAHVVAHDVVVGGSLRLGATLCIRAHASLHGEAMLGAFRKPAVRRETARFAAAVAHVPVYRHHFANTRFDR